MKRAIALLLLALGLGHHDAVRAQTAPEYVFCISATSTLCNTTTNPGNGVQGDDAWLAFGKLNLDILALQPPTTPYSMAYSNGNGFAGLLPGSTGTWCLHWTNLASAPISQWTLKRGSDHFTPVWQARTAAGNADLTNRAALFHQYIQTIRERERHAFEYRPGQICGARVRCDAKENPTAVGVVVRRTLTG